MVQFSHQYMTTGKTITSTRWNFVIKEMSLLFNMLSRLVITFLPRSKHLLTSWLQSPSAVILEPKKIKLLTVSTVSHPFAMKWQDWMPWFLFFECWALSQLFTLSPSSRGSLVLFYFLPLEWWYLHTWAYWYFSSLDSSLWFILRGIVHDVLCM